MSQEVIFNDGDLFFTDLLESISRAAKSIHIETYIFDLDRFGERFLAALRQASERGVAVKLLLDGAGCSAWDYDTAKKYRNERFEIQFFHPLIWQRKRYRLTTYLNPTRVIRGWSLLNHRNHRKVYLIDGKIAYAGSFNVSGDHLKSISGAEAWRDTGVKIDDERCKVLLASFMETWNHHQSYRLRNLNTRMEKMAPFLLLNRSLKERRATYHLLLQRLMEAQSRVYIINPYFIPTKRLRILLRALVARGVDVKLLVPAKSDFFGVQYAMEGLYTSLLKSGVEIHTYLPSFIHAKIMITDEQVVVGSSNLNSRSLVFDLEVDLEITKEENRKLILDQFHRDLKNSKKLELAEWRSRSPFRRFLELVFSFFRWTL